MSGIKASLRLQVNSTGQFIEQHQAQRISAHPETVFSPNLCVMLKILSSKHQLYACGKICACLDLEQKFSFLDGHELTFF